MEEKEIMNEEIDFSANMENLKNATEELQILDEGVVEK